MVIITHPSLATYFQFWLLLYFVILPDIEYIQHSFSRKYIFDTNCVLYMYGVVLTINIYNFNLKYLLYSKLPFFCKFREILLIKPNIGDYISLEVMWWLQNATMNHYDYHKKYTSFLTLIIPFLMKFSNYILNTSLMQIFCWLYFSKGSVQNPGEIQARDYCS